jgi:molybdopterin-guanine dinucleotide biosynthesis protein MobB
MRNGRRTEWLVPVVGVVGRSGVGKTTLLERLVPELRARGLVVGCVKHASHGFLADRPGKDSYRLFESGASAVALISCDQIASFWRRDGEAGRDVSLADAMATLPGGLDLVLAEGFSWEPIPRIAVVPENEARGGARASGSAPRNRDGAAADRRVSAAVPGRVDPAAGATPGRADPFAGPRDSRAG